MNTKNQQDAGTARSKPGAVSPSPDAPRTDSKIGKVIELLERKQGASLDELVEMTGWQTHTARAAMSGLKKRGYMIERTKRNDVSVYRIETSS